ncbi:unnamed protein product, partial [marine sediment metagenome]
SAMAIEDTAQRQFGPDETLPWEHLGGPAKKYLLTCLGKAMKESEKCKTAGEKV